MFAYGATRPRALTRLCEVCRQGTAGALRLQQVMRAVIGNTPKTVLPIVVPFDIVPPSIHPTRTRKHRLTDAAANASDHTDHRPADFRARCSRDPDSLAVRGGFARRRMFARRVNGGRQMLALLAAIAVPAMAAPGDWHGFGDGWDARAEARLSVIQPQPFERRGHSFPGSAFYYLEETPELLVDLPTLNPDVSDAVAGVSGGAGDSVIVPLVETHAAGAAANPFAARGTGLDRARASLCLAQAIWYEAATESIAGQRAVAQVVLNRVAHVSYPGSVCGVVYQGSQRRTGCQFSFTCDGSMRRRTGGASWATAQRLAEQALSGQVFGQVGTATHYHTNWVNPYWAPTLNHIGTIGAHRFYRMKGAAGARGSFRANYRGGEAFPRPNLGSIAPADPVDTATDSPALTRIFDEARNAAQSVGAAARTVRPGKHAHPARTQLRTGYRGARRGRLVQGGQAAAKRGDQTALRQ